jgi:hypothetical protein
MTPRGMFDTSVTCKSQMFLELESAYAKQQSSESRVQRYRPQVHDFPATLPLYLNHLQQAALAYPCLPQGWSGPLVLKDFGAIRDSILRAA